MGLLSTNLALALLSTLGAVSGQNGTNSSEANAAGPTWNHAQYETSLPVYPSRKFLTGSNAHAVHSTHVADEDMK